MHTNYDGILEAADSQALVALDDAIVAADYSDSSSDDGQHTKERCNNRSGKENGASSSSGPSNHGYGTSNGAASSSGPINGAASSSNPWAALGLIERSRWHVYDLPTGQTNMGILHKVNDTSLKGTCKLHPKCACWLSNVSDFKQCELDLYTWIAKGVDKGAKISRDDHQEFAKQLKLKYGMKVRAKNS